MSESVQRITGRLALGVLLGVAALPASAQDAQVSDASARIEELRQRADSLELVRDRAEQRLAALQDRQRPSVVIELDTVRVGPLVVVAEEGDGAYAQRVVENALAEMELIGDVAAMSLDSSVLLFERGRGNAFEQLADRRRHIRVHVPRWLPSRVHTRTTTRALGAALAESLPADLRAWSGNLAIALSGDLVYTEAFRVLALSEAHAAKACLAGESGRCADALSLTESGDSVRPIARASLLRYVLEQRGVDAWRVLESDTAAPLVDRMARASGQDATAMTDGWRARVIASRPTGSAGLGGTGIATLLWVLIAAAFAARSTRWRLG